MESQTEESQTPEKTIGGRSDDQNHCRLPRPRTQARSGYRAACRLFARLCTMLVRLGLSALCKRALAARIEQEEARADIMRALAEKERAKADEIRSESEKNRAVARHTDAHTNRLNAETILMFPDVYSVLPAVLEGTIQDSVPERESGLPSRWLRRFLGQSCIEWQDERSGPDRRSDAERREKRVEIDFPERRSGHDRRLGTDRRRTSPTFKAA